MNGASTYNQNFPFSYAYGRAPFLGFAIHFSPFQVKRDCDDLNGISSLRALTLLGASPFFSNVRFFPFHLRKPE